MAYRVINMATGEIIAETGDEAQAVMIADGFAKQEKEQYGVEEIKLRYQTAEDADMDVSMKQQEN